MSSTSRNILARSYLFLLLALPNIYAVFVASDLDSWTKTLSYIVVVAIGLCIPMLFLRERVYFIVAGILCLFLAPIEIASLYLNHSPATVTFVGFVYATNWRETMGVLAAVWPLCICLLALWISYFVIAAKRPNGWLIPRRIGLWVAGISLPILFAGAILFFSVYAKRLYHLQHTGEILTLAKDLTVMKFNKIYPYNIYLNTHRVLDNRRKARHAQTALSSFSFGLAPSQDTLPEIYVLVIGESGRSENFSLNGYERMTNPRLQKRSNVVSYNKMFSQAGTTEQSVPHMISRIPITQPEQIYTEKSLPEAFQEAGYTSIWLTNKSRAFYLERIRKAMDSYYETGKDMSVLNNYDEYLFAPLKEVLASDANKLFIVMHTMGSHWRYDTRYPVAFEQFTPVFGSDFSLSMINPANRDKLVNAYDNTILYTDYFLDSLIQLLDNKDVPALMLYMPDHGENLYDDERQLVLHGNYSTSQWLIHVPFIVWFSDEYAAQHPEKVQQMSAHAACRDNASVIFPSMIDAAGLRYINDTASDAAWRTRSIFSETYRSPDTLWVMTAESILETLPSSLAD